ncbi:ABC transporter permease [Serinibacter salmoneus]|uniref:Transport permease protein n=1 Tax=Serinibacter salmoneus TaxID=556530 RepID=A0A2A9D0Y8_9MICO|nr:ABC transporter permease [Serinibacter salmoneus]PFG20358.1 ABC-2 type transport system permease protein [Serinibacter salmoneus]
MTERQLPAIPPGMHRPGIARGLVSITGQRYLLELLVRKELRVRYQASFLGLAWSYVKPGVQFVVFYFVMGQFLQMDRALPPFAVYLFSGIVLINLFSEVLGNATRSVVQNGALVNKIFLPRQLFPVSMVWVALVHFVPQLLVLLVGSLIVGWRPDVMGIVAAVLAILIVLTLALGLGLAFGAVNVAYRDIENIVDLILMVAIWFSPVLYSLDMVRQTFGEGSIMLALYQANPLTIAVELFHRAFWYPAANPADRADALMTNVMDRGVIALVVCAIVLVLGDRLFTRLSRNFAQEL